MIKGTVKSRYEKVYDSYKNLEKTLLDENKGKGGFFRHILGNLAMGIPNFGMKGEKDRESFRETVKTLRTYRRLLNKYSNFRSGELTGGGYFNTLEGRTTHGKENKRAIFDSEEYVEYAEKMLCTKD